MSTMRAPATGPAASLTPRPASGLLGWLDVASESRGLHTLRDTGWVFLSYADLAGRVRALSHRLRTAGLENESVVAVATNDPEAFAVGFFGALHAGCTVLPLPFVGGRGAHDAAIQRAVELADPKAAIVGPAVGNALARVLPDAGRALSLINPGPETRSILAPADLAATAVLQLTSGSTGPARAVRLTAENLENQIGMIRAWLSWRADEPAASWLPLHHDMGLVGLMLTAVCGGSSCWQMTPWQFLLDPCRWLECFGSLGAKVTAAPPFGYSYAARRVPRESVKGYDFSGWRHAVVGADRIQLPALATFVELLKDNGFKATTLRPAYGLAEATLALTGTAPAAPATAIRLRTTTLGLGASAEILDERQLLGKSSEIPSGYLVSSGESLPGVEIKVVNELGRELGDCAVGEIVARSPSLSPGYLPPESQSRRPDDPLRTGDAGFTFNKQLYVLGRISDSVNVRGGQVLVEGIEADVVREITPTGEHTRVAVVPRHSHEESGITVIVERDPGEWMSAALHAAALSVGPTTPREVISVDRGVIPVTTSGKIRRRALSTQLAQATIPVLAAVRAGGAAQQSEDGRSIGAW